MSSKLDWRYDWHYYVVWIVAALSLALNGLTIATLLVVRYQAGVAFGRVALLVDDAKRGGIEYTVKIDEIIPISAEIPVQFTVQVPVSQTIPVRTTLRVPVKDPLLGIITFPITVPISMTVPISFTVDVPIDYMVQFDKDVPVKFDVPISIKLADTPLGLALDQLELVLLQEARNAGVPIESPPP